jgi:excisionase family DNA binding protein
VATDCDEDRAGDAKDPLFYTVDEAAPKLRVNRKALYHAIAAGDIPVVRVGRQLRIPAAWLRRAAGME